MSGRDHAIYCELCESWWSPFDFDHCPCSDRGKELFAAIWDMLGHNR